MTLSCVCNELRNHGGPIKKSYKNSYSVQLASCYIMFSGYITLMLSDTYLMMLTLNYYYIFKFTCTCNLVLLCISKTTDTTMLYYMLDSLNITMADDRRSRLYCRLLFSKMQFCSCLAWRSWVWLYTNLLCLWLCYVMMDCLLCWGNTKHKIFHVHWLTCIKWQMNVFPNMHTFDTLTTFP